MFDSLSEKLLKTVRDLRGAGKLTEANVDAALRQVRLNLLEADVHYQVVKEFIDNIKQKALGQEVQGSMTPGQAVVKIIYDELCRLLGSQTKHLNLSTQPPVPILLVGLQGAGKTTTSAKLAVQLKAKGRKPYLVPADVNRPAAIEQLTTLGKKIGVPVYPTQANDNPVKISEKALEEAVKVGCDTVIIDTAGRLSIDEPLIKELQKIVKAVNPQEILLVADAATGQDAVNTAKNFHAALDLTGVVLSKMDSNARAGAALSIKTVTQVPIKFMGTGEQPDALETFHPERVASRMLDMGDVLTLAEKAQEVFDQKETEGLLHKMTRNQFTMEDFLKQLKTMKKLGSMESILGMMPGFKKIKDQVNFDDAEKEMKRKEAIIQSMTRQERRNVGILNGGRRARIAKGSGTSVQEVNQFVREFSQMQKMMSQMGNMKNMMKMFGGGR